MSLLLSEEEIGGVLDASLAVEAVEEAFRAYGEGRVNMPPKSYLQLEKGDFRAMYGEIKGFHGKDICGLKWVNVHPGNPGIGLPTVMAKILLNDPDSAVELADLDGSLITDMRTGAAGAVAAKYLSRKDSSVVAFVGAGRQAYTQLECLLEVRDIKSVKVYDVNMNKARKFAIDSSERFGLDSSAVALEDALDDADILVTVTPSREPVVPDELVKEGVHINAIGADATGKQELDPKIFSRARVYIDDWAQASHSGEINVALDEGLFLREDVVGSLGDVVAGEVEGRLGDDEVTVFDSTGLILQDLALGYAVFRLCRERGVGEVKHFLSRVSAERLEGVIKRF